MTFNACGAFLLIRGNVTVTYIMLRNCGPWTGVDRQTVFMTGRKITNFQLG
jgi:hypothetical protein